jgi:predicted nucleotidyltransferase
LHSRLLNRGRTLFQKYGVRRVWLFGSVSQERALVDSDVDVLVSPLSAEDYWPLRRELEAAVGYPIDLYTQDDDAVFVRKVMRRGELIYDVQSGTA